jgi:hypothetical protein
VTKKPSHTHADQQTCRDKDPANLRSPGTSLSIVAQPCSLEGMPLKGTTPWLDGWSLTPTVVLAVGISLGLVAHHAPPVEPENPNDSETE